MTIDENREAFEVWNKANPFESKVACWDAAWLTSRKQALEEAMSQCSYVAGNAGDHWVINMQKVAKLLEIENNPTPEQIAEWRSDYKIGYDDAKTEQATEIAQLKAQLAELMPLAKFGALVMHDLDVRETFDALDAWCHADAAKLIAQSKQGYAPNIEATITKLLKD
jgi:hypothetical protein